MTVYYVSNESSNGWALGVDTNSGLVQSAPFLTLTKAMSVAGSADTVIFNKSSTVYQGNVASPYYLNVTCASLIGDPGNPNGAAATLQAGATSAAQVVIINNTGFNFMSGLIIDGQSTVGTPNTANGIVFSSNSSSIALQKVTFKQIGGYCIGAPNSSASVALDRCSVLITCTGTNTFNWSSATTITSLTVSGGSYAANNSSGNGLFYLCSSGTISGNVIFQNDINGNPIDFTGNVTSATGWNIKIGATSSGGSIGGTISITGTKHINNPGGAISVNNVTVSSVTINQNTFTGLGGSSVQAVRILNLQTSNISVQCNYNTYSGLYGFLLVASRNVTTCTVDYNTLTVKAGSATNAIKIQTLGTSTPSTSRNTINIEEPTSSSGGGIIFGSDGLQGSNISGNTSANGTFLNLGDTANTIYQGFSFTSVANTSTGEMTHFSALQVYLSKVGTPTGNVSPYLFSDSAGVPGTLLASSDEVINAAALTTTTTSYGLKVAPYLIQPGTKYWVVLTSNAATTNSTSYVRIEATTNTYGTIVSGNSTPTWTANSTAGWRSQAYTGSYTQRPVVLYNTIVVAGNPNINSLQLITLGGVSGGNVFSNRVYGTSYYPVVIKNSRFNPVIFAGNEVFLNDGKTGVNACVLSKASDDVRLYNNTLAVIGSNANAGQSVCYSISGDTLNWANPYPSTNFKLVNNILIRSCTTQGPIMSLDIGSSAFVADQSTLTPSNVSKNWIYSNTPYIATASFSATANGTLDWDTWTGLGYDANSTGANSTGGYTAPPLANGATPSTFTDLEITSANSAATLSFGANIRTFAPYDVVGRPYMPTPTIGATTWFTGDLMCEGSSISNAYALIWNSSGQILNVSNNKNAIFENYSTSNLVNYAVYMAPAGSSSVWRGNFPYSVAIGKYNVQYRSSGAAPSESDTIINNGTHLIIWTGSRTITPVQIGSYVGGAV